MRMVDDCGRLYQRIHTASYWLPPYGFSSVYVTGVVAMYATNLIYLSSSLTLPKYHLSPKFLPLTSCAFNLAIEVFKHPVASFLHTVAPLQLAEVVPRYLTLWTSAIAQKPSTQRINSTTILQSCLLLLVMTLQKDTIMALVSHFTKMTSLTNIKSTRAHAQSFQQKSQIASPAHISRLRFRIVSRKQPTTSI